MCTILPFKLFSNLVKNSNKAVSKNEVLSMFLIVAVSVLFVIYTKYLYLSDDILLKLQEYTHYCQALVVKGLTAH